MLVYRPLQQIAYERIKSMVQNHELDFDTVYSETKFASEFSVSRTPMREALIRLSNERYIDILPNRGFIMHKPSREDMLEAYHVRMALEGYCGQIVAREYQTSKGEGTIKQMSVCHEQQMSLNVNLDQTTLLKFWQYDLDFHISMIHHVNLPSFNQQFEAFMHFFRANRVAGYISLNRNNKTLVEHQKILDALYAGDPSKVLIAIREHLDAGLETILNC